MNNSLRPELCSVLEAAKTRASPNTLSSCIVNSEQRTNIDQTNSAYRALIFQQSDRHRVYDGRLSTGTRFLFSLPDRCRVSRAPRNYMNYAAPWFSHPRHSVVLSPLPFPRRCPFSFPSALELVPALPLYTERARTRAGTRARAHTRADLSSYANGINGASTRSPFAGRYRLINIHCASVLPSV